MEKGKSGEGRVEGGYSVGVAGVCVGVQPALKLGERTCGGPAHDEKTFAQPPPPSPLQPYRPPLLI
jgi:hypothetical protein